MMRVKLLIYFFVPVISLIGILLVTATNTTVTNNTSSSTAPPSSRTSTDGYHSNTTKQKKKTIIKNKVKKNLTFDFDTSDFAKVVNSPAFVDKTLFINKLFDPQFQFNRTWLITAPPKFGKSTVFDMIRRFFELETDSQGQPKTAAYYLVEPVRDTENYRLFADNKLNVRTSPERFVVDGYFGSFMVVDVDFRVTSDMSTYEDAVDHFRNCLRRCYLKYAYLSNSSKLNDTDKERFREWYDPRAYQKLTESNVTNGLRFLTEYLSKHFQRESVLLFDHYDDFVEKVAKTFATVRVTKSQEELLARMIAFQKSIFVAALADNEYLLQGFIAGRLNVIDLPFARDCSFLGDHRFVEFYGVTVDELDSLVSRRFRGRKANATKSQLRRMYCGYQMDRRIDSEGRYHGELCNPWSIARFFQRREYRVYWPSAGGIGNLSSALAATNVKTEVEMMLQGKPLTLLYYSKFDAWDVLNLNRFLAFPESDLYYTEYYTSWLLQRGYLTMVDMPPEPIYELFASIEHDDPGYNLSAVNAPNEEIRMEFDRLLDEYYVDKVCKFDRGLLKRCGRFFDDMDAASLRNQSRLDEMFGSFQKRLAKVFRWFSPDRDDQSHCIRRNEFGLHCLMFYIVYRTKAGCITETTCQNFRLDVITAKKDNFALILNVNYRHSSRDALNEIVQKQYHKTLEDRRLIPQPIFTSVFVGLNMDERRVPSISYLLNTTDVDLAKDVTPLKPKPFETHYSQYDVV